MEQLLTEGGLTAGKPVIIALAIVIMIIITAKLLKGIINVVMWLIIAAIACLMINYYALPLVDIEPVDLGVEKYVGSAKQIRDTLQEKREDVQSTIDKMQVNK